MPTTRTSTAEARGHSKMHRWTPKQINFIKRNWHKMSDEDIARAFKITREQVKAQRNRMGLQKYHRPRKVEVDDGIYFNAQARRCWLTESTNRLPKRIR
jgi:hypothetical protein